MKFDLKSLNRKELEKLRRDVDKAIERLADTERKTALAAAEKAAAAHGYSLSDLTDGAVPSLRKAARSGGSDGRSQVAPKFRNPSNPDETWSGRGRAPKWVEAYEADGGSREDLRI